MASIISNAFSLNLPNGVGDYGPPRWRIPHTEQQVIVVIIFLIQSFIPSMMVSLLLPLLLFPSTFSDATSCSSSSSSHNVSKETCLLLSDVLFWNLFISRPDILILLLMNYMSAALIVSTVSCLLSMLCLHMCGGVIWVSLWCWTLSCLDPVFQLICWLTKSQRELSLLLQSESWFQAVVLHLCRGPNIEIIWLVVMWNSLVRCYVLNDLCFGNHCLTFCDV